MVETAQVFNIKKVTCTIGGKPMTGVAPEGFGITPASESSVIDGLVSEVGFNVDTSTKAEATIALNASSPENDYLRGLIEQAKEGSLTPVTFVISVESGFETAYGFKVKGMHFAMPQGFPEFKTDKKNAPVYVYKFSGYGYYENTN
jgi:hypothetical protein